MVDVLAIIRVIIGIPFVIFVPGYILTTLFYNDLRLSERILISVGLSMAIAVVLGFALTGLRLAVGEKTFTTGYVLASYTLVIVLLGLWWLVKR